MKQLRVLILLLAVAGISATIDLNSLFDYESLITPNYITKDNTPNDNPTTNAGATLGRVLFYDKSLSLTGAVACASCHIQAYGFSDTARVSVGFDGGTTGRHSMRLANARYGDESQFFWDERATSLEDQTTRPIQDFAEMGFSGTNGQPDLDSLIIKLSKIDYYNALFTLAYGDSTITEGRMQQALAQFVRSIQSFDSKYDVGRVQVNNDNQSFPNFTAEENEGKQLFLSPPPNGGAGCQGCHRAPEFDIDPNSQNNGVIAQAADSTLVDLTNTRAPSLRNVFGPTGQLNGPLMHNGNFSTMLQVIDHYNTIPANAQNTNLDNRLNGQNLNLTEAEKAAVVAFLKTLTGEAVYTAEQWSDPFLPNGTLDWEDLQSSGMATITADSIRAFPNPVWEILTLELSSAAVVTVYDFSGKVLMRQMLDPGQRRIDCSAMPTGLIILQIEQAGKTTLLKHMKL